jgi:hypothetical protein
MICKVVGVEVVPGATVTLGQKSDKIKVFPYMFSVLHVAMIVQWVRLRAVTSTYLKMRWAILDSKFQ